MRKRKRALHSRELNNRRGVGFVRPTAVTLNYAHAHTHTQKKKKQKCFETSQNECVRGNVLNEALKTEEKRQRIQRQFRVFHALKENNDQKLG